uniref:Uncharacterized protein n=1 Tax=Arundo donax TaxID=35708 RepID=A0A0A9GDB4_ARUDO
MPGRAPMFITGSPATAAAVATAETKSSAG